MKKKTEDVFRRQERERARMRLHYIFPGTKKEIYFSTWWKLLADDWLKNFIILLALRNGRTFDFLFTIFNKDSPKSYAVLWYVNGDLVWTELNGFRKSTDKQQKGWGLGRGR